MKVYLVGGAVRDRLLGYPSSDRDWVVVGSTVQEMLSLGFQPVGRNFPVFLHPESKEEYALARTERKIGCGYHGFTFYADPSVSLEQDLMRRDLTINAMAQDEEGHLIDPFDGQSDLQHRLLCHVSPAFLEDPVRVLRLARFIAKLGFSVDPETFALSQKMVASGELNFLAKERLTSELMRGFSEPYLYQMLVFLQSIGFLEQVFACLDRLLRYHEKRIKVLSQKKAFMELSAVQRLAVLAVFLPKESDVGYLLQALTLARKDQHYIKILYRLSGLYHNNITPKAKDILRFLEISTAFHHEEIFYSLKKSLSLLREEDSNSFSILDYDWNHILDALKKLPLKRQLVQLDALNRRQAVNTLRETAIVKIIESQN